MKNALHWWCKDKIRTCEDFKRLIRKKMIWEENNKKDISNINKVIKIINCWWWRSSPKSAIPLPPVLSNSSQAYVIMNSLGMLLPSHPSSARYPGSPRISIIRKATKLLLVENGPPEKHSTSTLYLRSRALTLAWWLTCSPDEAKNSYWINIKKKKRKIHCKYIKFLIIFITQSCT